MTMTTTDIPLKCTCGTVRGTAKGMSPNVGTRIVCHCDDCQAFAHYLGRGDVLDACGGTDIFQIAPVHIVIDRGRNRLRSMRLSPRGMIRWYADCCNTPVGNTVSAGVPFIGVIHNFINDPGRRDEHIGPVLADVQTRFATAPLPADRKRPKSPAGVLCRAVVKVLASKLLGRGQPSPLFHHDGTPISEPYVLPASERARLASAPARHSGETDHS